MNYYIKAIVMLLLCVLVAENVKALSKFTDKKHVVQLEIIVPDSSMLNGGNITFTMYQNGINSKFNMETEQFTFKIDKSETKIELPISNNLVYGRIDFNYKNKAQSLIKEPFKYTNSLFLFEDTDDIQIILNKKHVTFNGIGSEKYTCAYSINVNDKILRSQFDIENLLFQQKNYSGYFEKRMYNRDSLFKTQIKLLNTYKTMIGETVYNLMLADCWGEYNYKLIGEIIKPRSITKTENNYAVAAKQAYEKYNLWFNKNFLPDSILTQSFQYVDYLFRKEQYKEIALNVKNDAHLSPFLFLHNSIQNKYTGIIRDKLNLLNFYYNKIDQKELTKTANELIANTNNERYKVALIKLINSKQGNAFPFELKDENNKIHKLSDYKGKLIVMDFWFTGCGGCLKMAKALRPIIDDYKSNPNIVFITVSVDGDKYKNVWLKSLKSENYSSKDEINLLAAEGLNSEIIKYYNIILYPTLILISKEGKVITSYPPNPILNSSKFKDFINDHL